MRCSIRPYICRIPQRYGPANLTWTDVFKKGAGRMKQLNNKGITLIELIISVVILAMVAAPFLHSFVTASNANASAVSSQRATTTAEYLLEQFKASTVPEIKSLYPAATVSLPDKLEYNQDYEITITNAGNLIEGGLKDATAVINLSPKKYLTSYGQNAAHNINDYDFPKLTNVSTTGNAVIMKELYDTYDEVAEHAASMYREVTVTLKKAAIGNGYTVVADITYDWGSGQKKFEAVYQKSFVNIPKVYVFYTLIEPDGSRDTLRIRNQLSQTQLQEAKEADEIEGDKAEVYIATESATGTDNLRPTSITCNYIQNSGGTSSHGIDQKEDDTTLYHTKLNSAAESSSDNYLQTEKIGTLYDMTVKITANGKSYASVSSSMSK